MGDFTTIVDVLSQMFGPKPLEPMSVHVAPGPVEPTRQEQLLNVSDQAPFVAARNEPVTEFLNKIGQIESNNRDDAQHSVIKQGMNKGTRAVGRYGLTPLTIVSTLRSMSAQQPILENLPNLPRTPPRGLKAQKQEAVQVASVLSPEQNARIAHFLAQEVLGRSKGDQERAALMWNSGINIPQERITGALLDKHEYVKRFRKLQQSENPDVPQLQEEAVVRHSPELSQGSVDAFRLQRFLDESIASRLARRYRER